MAHDFPGNVRELENIIEHAFVLCRGSLIEPAHFPPPLRGDGANAQSSLPAGLTLAAMEKMLLRDALRRYNGNRAAAARQLGIDTSTMFRKIKRLGIRDRKQPKNA
jgi:DNA-binding NtrC family response regulator